MRAVLIVNPNATSTTAAGRDLLAHALESRVHLQVLHTDHRGHASELARRAADEGAAVIVVHGGDGTVSEVVNGLLGQPGHPAPGPLPAIAVVPGGSANVFARSLGMSADPVQATNQLVDILDAHRHDQRRWRRISLGHCGERWFIFNAGMGLDGEVVAAMEAHRNKGKQVTAGRYVTRAVLSFFRAARRNPTLTVELPEHEPQAGIHFAFICNSNPWTYANTRAVWTNPGTGFESGLGVFASRSMNVLANLRLVRHMVGAPRADRPAGRHLLRKDDVPWVRVHASAPIATQVDGDFLGMRSDLTFTAVPDVLDVVAPAKPSEASS
ncbi:diacylglycerol kinase family lipid kinase [Mycobacterium sp. CBMA271]|uniref:diacylglycerol/lipid kinase family protein n=1 Tax=unclassified Mycobacteroides TaxID=2618759 RepID=UPI001327EBB2|nr:MULTISPECIES: diacylglycerol kinase family protein [unclassified Mycobacteroides]MUM16507.1 diacylglycerol kinase [Mycobacteroides sp. CBMA 326]MUM20547.1 diacylglycerol kinase family lipid kinase [Mycobacteroides sp. CBMA 271]